MNEPVPTPPVPTTPGHSEPLTHVCQTCGLVVGDDSKHSHETPPEDDDGRAALADILGKP